MRLISEGIGHLDDLDINEFIAIIKNIAEQEISEKIDGSNLAFGVDDDGKFYTTRGAKNKHAKLVYSAKDYPNFSTFNGFRAAHAALETQVDTIKKILQPGDSIEIEVVFGDQPNAVAYGKDGKNYVLFLRPLAETKREVFNDLISKLKNTQASIDSEIILSTDGEKLSSESRRQTFIFSIPQKIDAMSIKTTQVDKQIAKLEKFLSSKSEIKNLTNLQLLSTSLSSIKTDQRQEVKDKKADLLSSLKTNFILPIKQELLNSFFSKLNSTINSDEGNDIGIEGVVLLDPKTGNQVKIVDKDTYSTVNQFNHAIRAQILGVVRSTDANTPIEQQGGIIGSMKIKIADLIGNKDFARGAVIKKALRNVDGKNPKEVIVNFTNTLNLPNDFIGIKRKILAIISATNKELSANCEDFKLTREKYKLKLKTGKVIHLSPEVISRTLTTFAEAKVGILALFNKVKKTKSFEQIVAIFFGKYVLDLDEKLEENLLLEKKYQTDKKMYQNKDAWTLLNIYLATVISSILMYKADNKLGMRLLKDKAHFRMRFWTAIMSPLNFWGLVIWHASTPPIKKLIGAKVSADITKTTKKIPKLWFLNLHLDLSFGRDAPIHWNDHYKTLKFLQWHPNLKTERINFLIDNVFRYDLLTFDEKIKFINKLYFYVRQFIPSSPLLDHIRKIQHDLLLNPQDTFSSINMINEKLLKNINKIVEDESDASSSVNVATLAGNIASVDSRINKQIIRRQRNPNIDRSKNGKLKRFSK